MTDLFILTTLAQTPSPPTAGEPAIVKPDLAAVSEHATSAGLLTTNWLLIAVGVVLLLLSGLSIMNWWKHRGEHAHPLLVFSNTAHLAGLSVRQRWTLLWLARHQSLGSPITLMLSPSTFDHHAKRYLDTRLTWRREPVRRQLQTIRSRLFSDVPSSPVPA